MPISSYNLSNKVRDVSPALDFLRTNKPTLFSLARIGSPLTSRTAEWVDKTLGIKYVEVSGVSGLVLTVPDGSLFSVGMELSPISGSANYIVESISGNNLTVKKADSSMGNPAVGRYEVSDGGVLENALTGPQSHWRGEVNLNYVQLFRTEAELTAIALGNTTYDAENLMATQEAAAMNQIYHDLNKNMWKGYKALGSDVDAGRMGGLYQFCSNLQVAAGGKPISKDLIDSTLKLLAEVGGRPDYLICNLDQIKAISDLYANQIIIAQNDPVRGTYVEKIRNPYAPDGILNVITDPICPTKDVWFVQSDQIEFDYYSTMPLQSIDTTPQGFLGQRRTISCAGTAKFHHAKQCFASLRNLK